MSRAKLLYREKRSYAEGVIEMVVWQVPAPVPPSEHPFKYRLAYVYGGKRVVGYDNERGKGDHCHYRGRERRYRFTSFEALFADFWRDVSKEIENERS